MKTKRENKLNSYVKMILIMCGGGVIGAFWGAGIFMLQDGIDEPFPPVAEWLGNQVAVILWIFVVISLILSLICYRNAEHYIRQMDVEDDSLMEIMDCGYERWSSFGVAGSNVIVCLAMVFFAFGFSVEDEETAKRLLGAIVPFLLTVIVCTMYQVAAVRQVRRKDPSKKGDAADLHFEKEWLESCDEAEQTIIYKTSYKTFVLMKTILMVLLAIAMLGQLCFGTGMMAVVLLAFANIIMLTTYSIYSVKLQKMKYEG